MIRENEVARLKVTGEEVFVLAIDAINVANPGGTNNVTVRRPTSIEGGGLTHLVEVFTLPELETPDEYRTRILAERVAMQQKVMQSGGNPTQEAIHDLFSMQ